MASAQAPPADESGAVDEYVEDIPTSGGSTPAGGGSGSGGQGNPLPDDVAARLQAQGGGDADTLEEVATSSAYGAPQMPSANGKKSGKAKASGNASPGENAEGENAEAAPSGGALGAAATATAGESGRRLIALLIVLAVISAVVAGAVVTRHARSRNSRT